MARAFGQRAWIYLCGYRGALSGDRPVYEAERHPHDRLCGGCRKSGRRGGPVGLPRWGTARVPCGRRCFRRHPYAGYFDCSFQCPAVPEVRAFLFDLQRDLAKKNHVVMDGRDIGTVVLPNAQVKIFLTASPEERAQRRYLELREKGLEADYDQVLTELKQRDYDDSHRAVAPLVPAEDAIMVDSTGLTREQAFQRLLRTVQDKIS